MEPGGENLDLDEDDIYNKLPSEYKPYFRTELTENGNRAEREYSTIGQRKRCENGGFGFGYHNEIGNGNILFVERWIPSNPPAIKRWDELKELAKQKNWSVIISNRGAATSILLELNHEKIEKVIDTITTFLDTISMEELGLPFLQSAQEKLY